ncbi:MULTISPECIES: helix-turn-helix domain-containing protein [Actinoalloteichus]|uniref:DNA binding protein with helix-turn-helix domain n=1 Tax=Actinoalloteichus fjordicus TaxID=1612552 RepID=A0AAC9LH82_9PSEU|nr:MULTISPECIES: helix-turn-helix transcriptional regulator [Actinoalloteichus]APU17547.1 DNA binding protein with helix-turn-helix domain [Actinoalloteichus fjordicus]APU23625.1 DNA binding protein with helix-turn-helix domain [Actinoalloteichus sp. GBA129-24]
MAHHIAADPFGVVLRQTRQSAKISVTALAKRTGYHPSTLSKVETGHRRASRELAEDLDTALDARGTLIELWHTARQTTDTDVSLVWVLVPTTEGVTPMALSRRDLITAILAAAGGATAGSTTPAHAATGNPSPETITGLRSVLEEFWRLGRITDPAVLISGLSGQVSTIGTLTPIASGSVRSDLLALGARYAEYLAYMLEEVDDHASAEHWISQGERMAEAGGDVEMAAYMWVRRSRVFASTGDPAGAVEAAVKARHSRVGPSLRTASYLREAEGHARRGERTQAHRSLEAADEWHARDDDAPGNWCSRTVPGVVEVVRARVLFDLDEPRSAAEILAVELPAIPASSKRQRLRYGLLLALARSRHGEQGEAVAVARQSLGEAAGCRSAEARGLAVELRRSLAWSDAPGARTLRRDLTAFCV